MSRDAGRIPGRRQTPCEWLLIMVLPGHGGIDPNWTIRISDHLLLVASAFAKDHRSHAPVTPAMINALTIGLLV